MGAGGLAGFSFDLPQRNVDNAAIHSNYKCDILVVGGSFGGCAAALAAAKLGKEVIITEETSWIGGQATTQGVPMDEQRSEENTSELQSLTRISYAVFSSKKKQPQQGKLPTTT